MSFAALESALRMMLTPILRRAERCTLSELVHQVQQKVRVIEDGLASYLLDPKNQKTDPTYGQRPMLYEKNRNEEYAPNGVAI